MRGCAAACGVTLVLVALSPAAATAAAARTPRTWPFRSPSGLRLPRAADALPSLFADGRACSTGCRAPGAVPGWPVRPFHRQHPLRAGINELRPANLHFGVDILARDGTRVYAVQGGRVDSVVHAGRDSRVRIGSFEYWHISPSVSPGQQVSAYGQPLGRILRGAGHVHLSELSGNRYINPLRPGGRVLSPWRDDARPVLGRPRFRSGGRVDISGFDPVSRRGSRTPVLALAGLAYRLTDENGHRGALRWALRGTQVLPNALRGRIYARGSRPGAAKCVALRHPCRSHWAYHLAGGLAPRLGVRERRAYRLTAYAFDWAGRRSALDTRVVFVRGQAYIARPRG
jgi:hypothetical protein